MNSGASGTSLHPVVRILAAAIILLLASAPAGGQGLVEISAVLPDTVAPGQSATLLLEGSGFMQGCQIGFMPPVVLAEQVRYLGPNELEADVVVSPSAPPGDVTVVYMFQGETDTFDGLLEIRGVPQIGGIMPTQLFGPQDDQQLEVYGQYFTEQWVDDLVVSAVMASGNLGYDLGAYLTFVDSSAFRIDLETPQEYYANPCSIFIELSDPQTGIISSFQIPVQVDEESAQPVVDSVSFEPDDALVLGSYPAQVTGSLLVEGSNLKGIDPAQIRISGHKLNHLQLPAPGNPQLSGISITDTQITAGFKFSVTGDDRSFVADSSGSGVLHLGDLTKSFSYALDLEWPSAQFGSFAAQATGVIKGFITGSEIVLTGDELAVSAVLSGDYLREQQGVSLVLDSALCGFDDEYDLTFAADSKSMAADITITPLTLTADVPSVPFSLTLSIEGKSISADFSVPVDLAQVVPEVEIVSAEFLPAEGLVQPEMNTCQLHLSLAASNAELLEFDAESIIFEVGGLDLQLTTLSRDSISFGPGMVEADYTVGVVAPDVVATPLAAESQIDEISVAAPVTVRYEEFSEVFDATFFSSAQTDITLVYPPAFDKLFQVRPENTRRSGGRYTLPITLTGENLLAKYLEGATGEASCTSSSAGPFELTLSDISSASSQMLQAMASFDLLDLMEADPTARDETFILTLIEPWGGTELSSGEFSLQLGQPPQFEELSVSYPGVDELVGSEFSIEFSVSGAHFAPQYFEEAGASLRIVDPPLPGQFELGPVELESFTPGLVQAVVTATAAQFAADQPVVAELQLQPAAEGAPALSGQFVLDLVLTPAVQSVQATVDQPLELPDESEFRLLFQIAGEHFRPEYFEDLSIALEPSSVLPGGAHVIAAEPEITSLSASSAAGWVECGLEDAAALTQDELTLRCTFAASALELPIATVALQLNRAGGAPAPDLRFSVPRPARLSRSGGAAVLELPLSTSTPTAADTPVHGEVRLASGDSLEFDFELSAGQRLSESFALEATDLFDSLLTARGAADLVESAGPLSIQLTSPDLPDFESLAEGVPCVVAAPLSITDVEVLEVDPPALSFDDPRGLRMRIAALGDNLDTAALTVTPRFSPEGIPLRCTLTVLQVTYDRFEGLVEIGAQEIMESVEELDTDSEELEAEVELSGSSISGERESASTSFSLQLPPPVPYSGLSLLVDDGQQLYTMCRRSAAGEGLVEVRMELALQFLTDAGPVRNIRGLRFNRKAAEDAFVLQVGDEDYIPTDLRRQTENLLALVFELPQGAFETAGATPATLVLEPEDLVFSFEPLLASDQRTLEFNLSLHPGAAVPGGPSGTAGDGSPTVYTSLNYVDPDDPRLLYSGEMAFLRFEWESWSDNMPVYSEDGMLLGFDTARDNRGSRVQLDPAAYAPILNGVGRVQFSISTQKGLRMLQPEPVVFQPDGTAYVGLDLSELEDGAEFEIKDSTKSEREIDISGLLGDQKPDKPEPKPLPEFAPRFVDFYEDEVIIPVPGAKPSPLRGKECYEARTEFERIEEEERAKPMISCDKELEAYHQAKQREQRMKRERTAAGDNWTINQESRYLLAKQATQAAWDAYMECIYRQRSMSDEYYKAEERALMCMEPAQEGSSGKTGGESGAEPAAGGAEHRSVAFTASASGERCYGVDDLELDFAIPFSASVPLPEHDHVGTTYFGVVQAAQLDGEAVLEDAGQAYTLDPETGEVIFGDGQAGARLPAGNLQTGDIPEITVDVADPGANRVLFVPLLNADADPMLAVGVTTTDVSDWPGGWQVVGDPAVLRLEPWTDVPLTVQPPPVPLSEVRVELEFEPVTPRPADGFEKGKILFAQFDWQLNSNVGLTQVDGWTFALDLSSKCPATLPVRVQDSDAGSGNLVQAEESPGLSWTPNWDFSDLETTTGQILRNGSPAGTYQLQLDLDGTATLKADISGFDYGEPYQVDFPPLFPDLPPPQGFSEVTGLPGSEDSGPVVPPEDVIDDILRQLRIYGILSGGAWWFDVPEESEPEVDCTSAIDELEQLEADEDCDCSDEEEKMTAAAEALRQAQSALAEAQAAKDAADTAKSDTDKAKEEAEQAADDAEQAAEDAQAELERYLNEEVPGTTAVSGTASEAGAHGSGAEHAGAFACGSNFVGTRIGDSAAYSAHQSQINERWNAWKKAYHEAKTARQKAEAAAEVAEQAATDAEQAQAELDAAQQAADAAQAAFDEAKAAWEACKAACAGQDAAKAAARARVEECRAAGGMPEAEGGGDTTGGTSGGTGTSTGSGDGEGPEDGAGGGAEDGEPEDGGGTGDGSTGGTTGGGGGGQAGGGGGTTPGGGTTAGPGGGSGQGGDDTRPPGGWPWEQPPPTSTGDEDTDELIKLFEKIAELIKEWEKVKDELEDNDLVEEVRLYQSIGDLLDNIGELDSEISNALKEFASCNSEPLEELLAAGGDKIDAVIAALGLLKGAIGIYLIIDDDMSASRKAKLEAIKAKLDKACEKLEELKDKGEDAAELASTLAAIKEGEIWPDDIIAWLTDKLEGMLSDAASELADEIIEKAVEKVVGSKAAGPIISIIKDLCDAADAIGSKLDLDDLDEAITQALLDAIGKADSMEQYHIPCEWEYLAGKYVWIAGSPEDWENTEVVFKWEKHCLCSDGTWKTVTCPAGAPTVEDKDGRRYWTFPNIQLPKTECNPCYITVDVTIKRGKTQVTHTLLVGVQVCK